MGYNVSQITTLVNDVIEDLSGQSAAIQTLESTDLVSLGKAISSAQLLEGFFGSLCNRLAKTVYFIRVYDPASKRAILRDEHEFGAFVQKVYYAAPDVVDNPEYKIPSYTGGGAIDEYAQSSPYDVKSVVAVTAKIFDEQGTFAIEIVRPVDQIRSAFLSESEMMRFIDGIYLAIENKMAMAEEGLISTAVATAMAYDIENGCARNLLAEYNALLPESADTLLAADCMRDTDFLRYAGMEIKRTMDFMGIMSTEFNSGGYLTHTPREAMVMECLSAFSDALDVYLTADTYHSEMVNFLGDRFERVPRWQRLADDTTQAFAEISEIKIKHASLTGGAGAAAHIVNQTGVIAFVHDIEHVAAYFGHRRSWEFYNMRDDIYVHGETARNGYAVDPNANGVVFYVADAS